MSKRSLKKLNKADPQRPSVLLALSWYSVAIHRGIARYARDAGWSLDISMLRSGRSPANWRGKGIICIFDVNQTLDHMLKTVRVPVVHIGNSDHAGFVRVSADHDAVGSLAANYFLERGFKHFAFYVRNGTPGEFARRQAFAKAVRKRGFDYYEIGSTGACRNTPESRGYFDRLPAQKSSDPKEHRKKFKSLTRQLVELPKPVAIMSEYDDFSIEIIDACLAAKIPVPEQVAVLGVGDDSLRCEFAPIPLSSIDDNQELIGYEAAAALGRLMNQDNTGPKTILVPPRSITTRLSTDILAVEHPLVARALRVIWHHYTEPIGARQIAAVIPMSYRRLHDAFIRSVGHSIFEEITLKRLAHARRLLEESDKKTIEIAWLSGFTNQDRMSKVFKRVTGVTPSIYRQRFKKEQAR